MTRCTARRGGRFFPGYYGHDGYLPLDIFSGAHVLCARLRSANIDASAGSVEELTRSVAQIRARWPATRILMRGDMENRIKEQPLDLFADRTSTQLLRANQIRLYFSRFAYILLCALRRLGLKGTDLAHAQCATIRVRLLKLSAQVRVSVRRVWIAFSKRFPAQGLFLSAPCNVQASAALPSAP